MSQEMAVVIACWAGVVALCAAVLAAADWLWRWWQRRAFGRWLRHEQQMRDASRRDIDARIRLVRSRAHAKSVVGNWPSDRGAA